MNYYQILGVDNNAELIIIRAAYKALIQKYHPDKATNASEGSFFLEKTKSINEAYKVISDKKLRAEYDQNLKSNSSSSESNQNSQKNSSDTESESNNKKTDSNDNWNKTVEFFPELKTQYDDLNTISNVIAEEFKKTLLESKDFNNSSKIHKNIKEQYFLKLFGKNKVNQDFGKWLLNNKYKQHAIEFNKIINLLGSNVDYNKIIYDFTKKHDLDYGSYKDEKEKIKKKESEFRKKNKRYEGESFDPTKTLPESNYSLFFLFFVFFMFVVFLIISK